MNPKLLPRSLIISIILLEVLSITIAGSPWPWALMFHETLGLKILGWYLVAQIGLTALGWLVIAKGVPDKDCPICGRDLKSFIPVYGPLVTCPKCHTIFHKNCWIGKHKRCPVCYPDTEEETEVPFDFTSRFPRTPPKSDE